MKEKMMMEVINKTLSKLSDKEFEDFILKIREMRDQAKAK